MGRPADPVELSVVVPLFNEEESVRLLVEAVTVALAERWSWELILVDDGSVDATARIAEEIESASPRVRLIRLARNYGQTTAMQAGFDQARGAVVVTMDGDLQNDPRDVPKLVATLNEGYDLVVGYRERRQDELLTRRIPSWVANSVIRYITGIAIRDNGCSLKAYRRAMLERVRLYSDQHRFIPAIAAGVANARITEVPVRHHARRYGRSKYGLSRVFKVLADLLVIRMIRFSRERPLRMFSAVGVITGAVAATLAAVAVALRASAPPSWTHVLVLPGSALLVFWLACYLFMLGLLGEVAAKLQREDEQIDEIQGTRLR